jgi:lipopolysaccharide biosynthesis glycosyltransferase
MRISIVMACDEGYAMPLTTALRSIADSNSRHWPLNVYLFADRFREQTRERVIRSLPEGSISLRWLHINLDRFSNLATLPYISNMTFARFLLGDFLPHDVTRVLYLDSDILVLGDLGPLWTSRLDRNCVGAVPDVGFDTLANRKDPQWPGMPLVERYFNAGVLLINLDIWRQQQIGERAAQYLSQHPDSPFADQDALNVVLDGMWTILAEEWNFQRHWETDISLMKPELRPTIVHFVTANKPWKREFHTPNESLFDRYRGLTQFSRSFGMRLVDAWKTTWFLLKRELKHFAPLRQIWYRVKSRV